MGFDDTRGTLFHDICRIAACKSPKYLFLENVKGLLSHDGGHTFAVILTALDELGYDAEWQVLDSQHFGVPQHRERVFIIGHSRTQPTRQVFPLGCSGSEDTVVSTITARANQAQRAGTYIESNEGGIALDAYNGGKPTKVAGAIRQNQLNGGSVVAIPILTPDRPEKRQDGRRFKEDGEPAFTLTAQDKHGIFNGKRIRRLTPTECERLQGYPDGWTKEASDSQRYKMLGNAVTVNVIEAIARRL
jgi:DNA (cytosine-5)-methyltransferase 1